MLGVIVKKIRPIYRCHWNKLKIVSINSIKFNSVYIFLCLLGLYCALSTEMTSSSSFSSCEHSQLPVVWGFRLSLATVAVFFNSGRPSLRGRSSGSTFQRLRYDRVSFLAGLDRGFAVAAPPALAEAYGEQAVDDGVQAGVEKPKDEQDVGEGMRDFSLQVVWEEPVPQTQQVVRSPADYEADHNDDAHFQSSHSRFGDVVLWATEMWLICGH